MHNLKELKVWQKAIDLVTKIYKISQDFPSEEKYGLTSQIRRCSISIPSNISEGAGRNSNKKFAHFLGIANGSAYELQTQIIICKELALITNDISEEILNQINEIQKMIYRFQDTLNSVS